MLRDIELPAFVVDSPIFHTYEREIESGDLLDQAIQLIREVDCKRGGDSLTTAFRALIEEHPGLAQMRSKLVFKDQVFMGVAALAAIKDISVIAETLAVQSGNPSPLSNMINKLIKDYADYHPVDFLDQLVKKGPLSMDQFLTLYGISIDDLALDAVLKDNPAAFRILLDEALEPSLKALSSLPFDPLTAIRADLYDESEVMSAEELHLRIFRQFRSLYSNPPHGIVDPSYQVNLGVNQLKEAPPYLPQGDHGLRHLPGYYEALRRRAAILLPSMATSAIASWPLDGDRLDVLAKLFDDFGRAGISRSEVFNLSILEPYLENDQAGYQPPQYMKASMMDFLAQLEVGSLKAVGHASIQQIHLLLAQEPLSQLEALCKKPEHWYVLYQLKPCQNYVSRMKHYADIQLNEDLGL